MALNINRSDQIIESINVSPYCDDQLQNIYNPCFCFVNLNLMPYLKHWKIPYWSVFGPHLVSAEKFINREHTTNFLALSHIQILSRPANKLKVCIH